MGVRVAARRSGSVGSGELGDDEEEKGERGGGGLDALCGVIRHVIRDTDKRSDKPGG